MVKMDENDFLEITGKEAVKERKKRVRCLKRSGELEKSVDRGALWRKGIN